MIHDAEVEVTCDGKDCRSSCRIKLHYVYRTHSEKSGQYDDDDKRVEKELVQDMDWIVRDGKHFCGSACAKNP